MTRNSPIAAMLWENWRLTRVEAAQRLAVGIVAASAALSLANPNLGPTVAFWTLITVHSMIWLSIAKLNGGRFMDGYKPGFAFYLLYTRPVRTITFVAVAMAYDAISCTLLYVAFSYVLSGVATVEDFRSTGREASVAFAISKYMTGYEWLSRAVTVAILFGFSSVILVMLLGQSRVFYSMSKDGLVPSVFSDVHPKYRTPYKSNVIFFVFTALFAAFVPGDIVGEMTSIGTLFAFILVCIGVWIMRNRRPDLKRGFTVPALPVVAMLGVLVCGSMIFGLGWRNWMRLIVWLIVGFVFYFGYGRNHSRIDATA